jgi:hypothetical protein
MAQEWSLSEVKPTSRYRMNGPGCPGFSPTVATLKLFGIARLDSEGFYGIWPRMRNRPDCLPDRYSARH